MNLIYIAHFKMQWNLKVLYNKGKTITDNVKTI